MKHELQKYEKGFNAFVLIKNSTTIFAFSRIRVVRKIIVPGKVSSVSMDLATLPRFFYTLYLFYLFIYLFG